MRKTAVLLTAAFLTTPATARDDQRPITEDEITAIDVAATPVDDLNLRGGKIPPQLIAAQQRPYDLTDLGDCQKLAAAVGEFDALLGEDLDVAEARRHRPSAGRLAQWAVGSFIPFRGAIREISGANAQKRKIDAAIRAGLARRAFLKGVGEAKGCLYPARSAPPEVLAARAAERQELAAGRQGRPTARGNTVKPGTQLTLAAGNDRQP